MARKIMIGLLTMGLVALTTTLAFGYLCPPNQSCRLFTKCVEADVTATQLGNVSKTATYVTLSVAAYESNGVYPTVGVVCGNPGTNNYTPAGANLAEWTGTLYGATEIDPSTVTKNGKAYLTVSTEPTQDVLDYLSVYACGNQKEQGKDWVALDMVICNQLEATLEEVTYDEAADTCYIDSTTVFTNCWLPNCDTIEWDPITQTFEKREYECDGPTSTKYKVPVLYSSVHGGFKCPNEPIE